MATSEAEVRRKPFGDRVVRILVVLLLLTLLVAFLCPSLGNGPPTPSILSMSNMRQIVIGAIAYAKDHDNQWPDTFDRFSADYLGDSAKGKHSVFVNPREGYLTYRLVPLDVPLNELEDASSPPVLYEVRNDGTIDRNGAISYADGHVEGPKAP